jgi:hypothetical protein
VTANLLQNYEAVVYHFSPYEFFSDISYQGHFYPISTSDFNLNERNEIAGYLNGNGNLFISGQAIGWALWSYDPDSWWYNNYLHADWYTEDTGIHALSGDPGPIGNGISFNLYTGTGAPYTGQQRPDGMRFRAPWATNSFVYTGGDFYTGMLKADTGDYKVVYSAFPFEAIDDQGDRNEIMDRIMNWFGVSPPPGDLTLETLSIDEDVCASGGAGDNGQIDPGENIGLTIILRNTTFQNYTNVVGTLSSSDPRVTVTTPGADYGTIGPNSTGQNGTLFWFTTDPATVTCTEMLPFTLSLTADQCPEPIDFTLSVTDGCTPCEGSACPQGEPMRQSFFRVGKSGNNIVFGWTDDNAAVGGFNLYETTDRSIVSELRLLDYVSGTPTGHTPVMNFSSQPGTYTNGMTLAEPYFQLLGACNSDVEGPN